MSINFIDSVPGKSQILVIVSNLDHSESSTNRTIKRDLFHVNQYIYISYSKNRFLRKKDWKTYQICYKKIIFLKLLFIHCDKTIHK